MSGVLLSHVGSVTQVGMQTFDWDLVAKINTCNDLAWTCINLVSSTAAMGKLKVRIKDDTGIKYLPDHPLQKMLDFPNTSMSQFDLIQSYVTHQNVFGTVAIILLRAEMLEVCPVCIDEGHVDCMHKLLYYNQGPIAQMMPVHPSNIEQNYVDLPDGRKRKYFFYVPEPGRKYPIHPDNIITDPMYNTDVGWYGVSPTYLLKRWLDLDNAMTQQVTDFFENGAIPSLLVNMKPGTNFTYEQEPDTLMQMMKDSWMKKFSSSGAERKTPAFVYGDVHVERIQEQIEETIAKNLYYEIQGRVCATYGVPVTLYEMGMRYGSQRSSAEQHEKDFYNRTICKILARFESKINQLVVPSYDTPGLHVVWDLSEMGIASFLLQEKKAAIKKDWELGLISRDTARTLLGYEPIGGELGDDFYRLTVMSDGNNASQASGMDNRLKQPKVAGDLDTNVATPTLDY
jgi:HK97 family phage portal protein